MLGSHLALVKSYPDRRAATHMRKMWKEMGKQLQIPKNSLCVVQFSWWL